MDANRLLQSLFALARRTPPPNERLEIPFGLETAVLAHWREARAQRPNNTGLLTGLRWAALFACAIALLAGALEGDELSAFNHRNDPETRVADSAIVAGYGYE